MTIKPDSAVPYYLIERVLKRFEVSGDLKQETSSLVRAFRQGLATELEEERRNNLAMWKKQ